MTTAFKLGTFKLGTFFREGDAPFAGLVLHDRVYALHSLQPLLSSTGQTLSGADSLLNLMQAWESNFAALQAAVAQPGFMLVPSTPLLGLQLELPLRPTQIFCAGANYREHVIEIMMNEDPGGAAVHLSREERREQAALMMDERAATGTPFVFVKTAAALNRAEGEIVLPSDVTRADWELELAVVIGRKARRVSQDNALDYVAGYTVANDLSARERQYRTDMKVIGADWLAAKCCAGFPAAGAADHAQGFRARRREPAPDPDPEWPDHAGFLHRRHGVRRRPTDRVRVQPDRAVAGRRAADRLPSRQRLAPRTISGGRRRAGGRDRGAGSTAPRLRGGGDGQCCRPTPALTG